MDVDYRTQRIEYFDKRFEKVLESSFNKIRMQLSDVERYFSDEKLRGTPIDVQFNRILKQLDSTRDELKYINKELYCAAVTPRR